MNTQIQNIIERLKVEVFMLKKLVADHEKTIKELEQPNAQK